MGNHTLATPATVIMTAEEFSTDVPLHVTTFAATQSLPLLLRHTPPHVMGVWRQAITGLETHPVSTQPLHTFSDPTNELTYAIWHHGRKYIAVVSGRLDALLPHTDTTENERESLLLAASRQATDGRQVMALATIELTTAITTPREVIANGPLSFTGCVALELTPNPKALAYAHHANAQGLRLLLLTCQPVAYARAIGLRNGLITKAAPTFDAHELLGAPSSAIQTTALRSATVIGNISPQTASFVAGALSGLTAHLTPAARKLLVQ